MTSRSPFIHLHTHSHYSLLDGLSKIDEMVKTAKEFGMPALAITDHGNLYGAIDFYKACTAAGIKPIIGLEAYVAHGSRHDKTPNSGSDKRTFHLTLLAKNETGYKNLIQLVTKAHLEGYYYKPRVDKELLRVYSEGLIALSGCYGGELCQALKKKDLAEARRVIAEHQEIFGKENYFMEVMSHPGVEGLAEVTRQLIELSRELNIPLVGTQDSHYLHKDDHRAHEVFLAIQTNTDINDENRFSMGADSFHFIDTDTAYEMFKDIPEAVENTARVAEMCNIKLDLGKWVFPHIETLPGQTHDETLRASAIEGLKARDLDYKDAVKDRLDYELEVIKNKGYSPYFLIVADLIRYAREHGILTNIRGSVAGSLTTYALGITSVDPLKYKIPFERFLNPERPSPPDIDMDFADNRRDEVIEYARKKYGADKVAQIGTFGSMLAKGAVRDIARALGHPYAVGDKISRLIPFGSQGFPMTIDRALEISPELASLYEKDATTTEIIDLAKRIEGCVRHISVHAAGVVIAPSELTDFTPIQLDPKGGKIITQYDMYAIEDAGLLKFDFLGIRNLSILADAARLVKELRGKDIDLDRIPLDDKKTFEMLARGETMGLFQLNGQGMTRYLKELRPTSFNDINVMVALYRPGPLESIPEYIRRKHNPALVAYLDPRMEDILKDSYGVITYQEDVMVIAIKLAGYSWLEADKFRKAMGKKIPAEMAAQKEKFLEGLKKNGMSEGKANALWKLVEPFAAYGFNKAHAASYGRVAYQTAYMKANFPAEYMSAVLTAESGDIEELARIIEECKRMKIEVLPPDVNQSFRDFTVVREKGVKDRIRFGLYAIKNLGADIGQAIIDERQTNGHYTSIAEFLRRVTHKNLNKKSLEALIQSGAMDSLGDRGTLLSNMEMLLSYHKNHAGVATRQNSLFGRKGDHQELRLAEGATVSTDDKLRWEKELLGLYVSGHPLDKWKDRFEKNPSIKRVKEEMREGMIVVIAGLVEDSKMILTKNGEQMAFFKLADYTDAIEGVAFPRIFASSRPLFEANRAIAIKGRISERNGEKSFIAEAVKELL